MTKNSSRLAKRSLEAAVHATRAAWSGLRNVSVIRKKTQFVRPRQVIAIGLIQHIGDIVASEPVVRKIRKDHSDAFIIWCVREPYRELVESLGVADSVASVRCLTEWILLRILAPFDQIIDLHVNHQACPVCAIPLRKPEDRSGITSRNYYQFGSLTEIYSQIAQRSLDDMQPRLRVPDVAVARVNGLSLPNRFVTFHARSEQTVRDWVDERWFTLAEKIFTELNIPLVEVGLVTCMPSKPNPSPSIDLCGQLSLLETAEVIRRSELFIGIDSGPAHLANAVGTPGIILLGSYFVFTSRVPYSGAFSRPEKCQIIRTNGPMRNISVDDVFAAVQRLSRGRN
jgi:heptosyltransferase-3